MTIKNSTVIENQIETDRTKLFEDIFMSMILLVSIITTVVGLTQDQPFWDWAWDRHLNPWSWVVRPFTIPVYAYFAYKRRLSGLLITVIVIATSMYWFPIPASPNPDIAHFLTQEQIYLTTRWTPIKIIWSSLVPITMVALAVAFWRQSMIAGIAVVNVIAFLKITWSVTEDPQSGWILIPFALIGLLITDLLIIFYAKRKGIAILSKE